MKYRRIIYLLLCLLVFIGTFWLGKTWRGQSVAGAYAEGDAVTRALAGNSIKGTASREEAQGEVRDEAYFLKKLNQRVDVPQLKQLMAECLALEPRGSFNYKFPYELNMVLQKWGEIAPLQGIEELMKVREGKEILPFLFRGWASKNPEAAMAYYKEHKDEFGVLSQKHILENIIQEYAWYSPEKAWKCLLDQKQDLNERQFNEALYPIMESLRKAHPELVPQYAKLISEMNAGTYVIYEMAQSLARHDPENKEWIQDLPDTERIWAESGRIMAISGGNLEEIERMITQLPTEDQLPARKRISVDLLEKVGPDMEKKLNWVLDTYPESKWADINFGIMAWMQGDPDSFGRWVESLPQGGKKELMKKKWHEKDSAWRSYLIRE